MEKVRDSKYELLRIVSMFMIVLYHIIVHGHVIENVTGSVFILVEIIKTFLIVHVNSFILVTGYYQCKSNFKSSKLFSLNNAAWFYRVSILVVLMLFNVISVGKLEILDNVFPLDLSVYWFIDMYLILYCISPFLNILINNISKSTHQKLLLSLFVIFSILPSFTGQRFFFNNIGFSITNFVFLYFIGAYLRNYPIKFFDFYKILSLKFKRILYGTLFTVVTLFNIFLYFFGTYMHGFGTITDRISEIITHMTFSYDNPLVILAAVFYFLWFGCLEIRSKFINKLSTLTFGIYLIHDNPYVRVSVYQLFGLKAGLPIYSYMIIPKMFVIALTIFIACALIEWIRQIVFKFIYGLSISGKFRSKFKNYVTEIKTRQPLLQNESEA